MGRQSVENSTDPMDRQLRARVMSDTRAPVEHRGFRVQVRQLKDVLLNTDMRIRAVA